jgi:hypothetical protein
LQKKERNEDPTDLLKGSYAKTGHDRNLIPSSTQMPFPTYLAKKKKKKSAPHATVYMCFPNSLLKINPHCGSNEEVVPVGK